MDFKRPLTMSLLLLLLSTASAQLTDVEVKIVNAKPSTHSLHATSVVKSDSSNVVWCVGVVEDRNSYVDLRSKKAFIGMRSNGGYIQQRDSSFLVAEQESVTSGSILAGFYLGRNTPYGVWSCVIECTDNAEDKAVNSTTFVVAPSHCGNNALDENEEAVDCGGPCLPCSCGNGVLDEGEEDVDCGGPCIMCTSGSLTLSAPSEIVKDGALEVRVTAGGEGVKSLVRVTKPGGETMVSSTDDAGRLTLEADTAGEWFLQADLYGYEPAEAAVGVKVDYTPYLIAVAAIALLAAAIYLYRKKLRMKDKPTRKWDGPSSV